MFLRLLAGLEGSIAQAADRLLDLFACFVAQSLLAQELQKGRIVAAYLGGLQGLLLHPGGVDLLVIAEILFVRDVFLRG